MGQSRNRLAELVGSRICHDLISPVGAINNGLELLGMTVDATGPEMDLIGQSVGNASARIRFFRIAYGAAGDQMISQSEITAILRGLYAEGRIKVSWDVTTAQSRTEVRMAFLALQCIEAALAYGGQINVSKDGDTWTLTGVADKVNVDHAVWAQLAERTISDDLRPAQVQFALLPSIALEEKRTVVSDLAENRVTIRF